MINRDTAMELPSSQADFRRWINQAPDKDGFTDIGPFMNLQKLESVDLPGLRKRGEISFPVYFDSGLLADAARRTAERVEQDILNSTMSTQERSILGMAENLASIRNADAESVLMMADRIRELMGTRDVSDSARHIIEGRLFEAEKRISPCDLDSLL